MKTETNSTARETGSSGTALIRTPDQRLRVFVSSTLQELSDERAAVRRAVEHMRLSPVMFEIGARPHPPSTLYRSYLSQSHIFIGIYWESYGWVAPDMDISGLEDEYLLCGDQPKLIYIKNPAPEREPRLKELLGRIANEGVSYKKFLEPAELEQLVANDLALLLTERFEQASHEVVESMPAAGSNIPALVNLFVGREREMTAVKELLGRARLVTVTGPGGIGKSRLALELATELSSDFPNGVHLVHLQSVRDAELVASAIVHSLGADELGGSPLDAVVNYLRDKNMLLVLDNFEQVVTASDVVVRILSECPGVTVVVTSRQVLNVRGEHELSLAPLEVPPQGESRAERVCGFDSVRLFLDRARAVNPALKLQDSAVAALGEIARRLDGLPLALELAAARSRIMSPESMLDRLEDRFKLLRGGWRDLPERHHTLRSTIDWSYDLLSDGEKKLFERLGIFNGGATLEAAEAVCSCDDDIDVLEGLASLIDKSLVCQVSTEGEPRYAMLETIREYALDRLKEQGELEWLRDAHASYFEELATSAGAGMRGPEQDDWMMRLDAELGNFRSAMSWLSHPDRAGRAAAVGWSMWQFWWLRGHIDEGRRWMNEIIAHDLEATDRARALAVAGIMAFWASDYGASVPPVTESLALFEAAGDESGIALCELPLGFVESVIGDTEQAVSRFKRSCEIFDRIGDRWGSAIARIGLCWMWVGSGAEIPTDTFLNSIDRAEIAGTRSEKGMALGNLASWQLRNGDLSAARSSIERCIDLLFGAAIVGPSSYALDVVAELALRESDLDLAARLFGAADGLRTAIGQPLAPMHVEIRQGLLQEVEAKLGSDGFKKLYAEGCALSYQDAMTEALGWCRSSG